jgi:tripartite-type tricarboxylate transporter receptor subunit TctC
MVLNAWAAYVAPKGLPAEVYQKLIAAFTKAGASREAIDLAAKTGALPTPDYVGKAAVKFLDEDAEMQRPILETLGVAKGK